MYSLSIEASQDNSPSHPSVYLAVGLWSSHTCVRVTSTTFSSKLDFMSIFPWQSGQRLKGWRPLSVWQIIWAANILEFIPLKLQPPVFAGLGHKPQTHPQSSASLTWFCPCRPRHCLTAFHPPPRRSFGPKVSKCTKHDCKGQSCVERRILLRSCNFQGNSKDIFMLQAHCNTCTGHRSSYWLGWTILGPLYLPVLFSK